MFHYNHHKTVKPIARFMKKLFMLPVLAGVFTISAFTVITASLNKEDARKAFEYLNSVRQNPGAYSNQIGTDLGSIKKMPALRWNDTLAKVAEAKALDMAERKYFGHTDPEGNGMNIKIHKAGYSLPEIWMKNKDDNMFESISAGNPSCIDAIKSLVLDKGVDPPNHRRHLLGIDPFWADCYDVGIGYATDPGSEYGTYTCILIAKHK
jgi:uncharacterized protein YkwD